MLQAIIKIRIIYYTYKIKVSLRRTAEEDDDNANIMRTTPEVKCFIAKKLDDFLEKEILDVSSDASQSKCNRIGEEQNDDMGVRLLLQSKTYVKDSKPCNAHVKKERKKRVSCSSSSESDDEEAKRFRSAAVSTDSILMDSAISSHKVNVV